MKETQTPATDETKSTTNYCYTVFVKALQPLAPQEKSTISFGACFFLPTGLFLASLF